MEDLIGPFINSIREPRVGPKSKQSLASRQILFISINAFNECEGRKKTLFASNVFKTWIKRITVGGNLVKWYSAGLHPDILGVS